MPIFNAYAKINLFLDIESKRQDGFHDILSVMQTVNLCDELTLERTDSGIEVENEIEIEKERDLTWRAARAFFDESGISGGACISVKKRIPMGAGLAGGSADAACVLRGLNELYGSPFSLDALAQIGLMLGSDVPFCVIGGTKLTRGRGERMTDMPKMPDCAIVVAIADDHVSTPAQFAELDRRFADFKDYKPNESKIKAISEKFAKGSVDIGAELYNIFEITGRFSLQIKEIMQNCGAIGTLMSGSGSSVFGIFENDGDAEKAQDELIISGYQAYICRPIKI